MSYSIRSWTMISRKAPSMASYKLGKIACLLLFDSPVHGQVCNGERRHPIQRLCSEPSPCIENSCICGASEWPLSVRGDGIGHDALLSLGACVKDVSTMYIEIYWRSAWWSKFLHCFSVVRNATGESALIMRKQGYYLGFPNHQYI